MPEHLQPRPKDSVTLSEATVRLAEKLAERFGITVQELIEVLLLECAGERPAKATPPPQARGTSRVIDLDQARERRTRRP
jgi:hypothetical protein